MACAGALAGASPAFAADRYAAPGGDGPEPCTAADRCGVLTAVDGAAPGDRVFLAPGDYGSPDSLATRVQGPLSNDGDRIEIVGELRRSTSGEWQRPVVFLTSSSGPSLQLTGAGGAIQDVTIDSDNAGSGAFGAVPSGAAASVLLERVLVRERGGAFACAFDNPQPQVVRSSACLADADGAAAIQVVGSVDLLNVTALATGGGGRGLSYSNAADPTEVTVVNSIVRGSGPDVSTTDAGTSTAISLVSSSYSTADFAAGTDVEREDGKQAEPPLLADPAAGDLRQLEGSPTIDAGAESPASGNFDLDGGARVQRGGIDIGAYELAPPPSPPPSGEGTPPTNPPPPRTITVVRISRVAVTAKQAKVGRTGRLSIPLACRGGGTRCRGLIALTANLRLPGHRSKSEIVLARTRFTVSASRTARIRIRLGRAAHDLLADAKRGRLTAQLRLTAGADERVTKLTLLAPKNPKNPKQR